MHQGEFQRPGNGTADEGPNTQCRHAPCPANRGVIRQDNIPAGDLCPMIQVYQKHAGSHIEYRGNPSLPMWNRNSHINMNSISRATNWNV